MRYFARGALFGTAMFLATASSGGIATAQGWDEYVDPDSGYRVSIPPRFQQSTDSQGRLTFRDASGDARVSSFQGDLPPNATMADIERIVATADWIQDVTYRAAGKSWFVLSGHYLRDPEDEQQTIFYFKAMLNRDRTRYSAIEVSYPLDRKKEFDPIVTRIEKSLRPPQ